MNLKKRAVVVFNLGGPDTTAAIAPFLFNLFYDRAIINVPNPLRWVIAKIISTRRAPVAADIYAKIGGGSPILEKTQGQAVALQNQLNEQSEGWDHQVFISMRYWHPMADETTKAVAEYEPDEIVLLPLYPQYSLTTTATGFDAWEKASSKAGLDVKTRRIVSYEDNAGWIKAQADLLQTAIRAVDQSIRILFSAHGLPKKTVSRGDPYPDQVDIGAKAIIAALAEENLDWQICYQSRVGPLEWIGPSLDEALEQAARDDVGVVVLPISFVSDHSETLVELDMEYRDIAEKLGVSPYIRVPVVAIHPAFIDGLSRLVLED